MSSKFLARPENAGKLPHPVSSTGLVRINTTVSVNTSVFTFTVTKIYSTTVYVYIARATTVTDKFLRNLRYEIYKCYNKALAYTYPPQSDVRHWTPKKRRSSQTRLELRPKTYVPSNASDIDEHMSSLFRNSNNQSP
jgi:hypothetical protein